MVALSHLFTYFNSRPHGGRLFYRKLALRPHYFNSRPHGGRRGFKFISSIGEPFQLTHSRRATSHTHSYSSIYIFQLTPSRRATLPLLLFRPTPGYFNSRPHGGRRGTARNVPQNSAFQLTPSRRATAAAPTIMQIIHFNSRPHGGRHSHIPPIFGY